jgi:hypothetical protein
VGPRASLDAEAGRKILCFCRGSNPGRPVCSQTLYWLSCPGSCSCMTHHLISHLLAKQHYSGHYLVFRIMLWLIVIVNLSWNILFFTINMLFDPSWCYSPLTNSRNHSSYYIHVSKEPYEHDRCSSAKFGSHVSHPHFTCFTTRCLLALLADVPGGRIKVTRTNLIVGLITPHCTYLTIMKPVREAKARFRAVVPLMMMMVYMLHGSFSQCSVFCLIVIQKWG